jgi:hypothetical protein
MSMRPAVWWIAASLAGISLMSAVGLGYFWGAGSASKRPLASAERHIEPSPPDSRQHLGQSDTQRLKTWEQALERAAPVASAAPLPAEPSRSPEAARLKYIERVRTTGPDRRNLVADARRVSESWSAAASAQSLDVTFDQWECYRAGCLVNARHGSADTVDRATEAITKSAGFMGWNGEKLRTGPVEVSKGKPEVTWILFAPPEGEKTLPDQLEMPAHASILSK